MSIILIPSSTFVGEETPSTLTSDKVKGDGYFGFSDGLHTVGYFVSDFVGIIQMQATLAQTPTEDDWFNVDDTSCGDGAEAISTATYKNFSGNFVWVRANVTSWSSGTITKIIYSN
jgi:hypothetical protein